MTTVTKTIEFDAAHRLMDYKGKCANLHGHRYKVEVEVRGDQLNTLGMVRDFGEIKEALAFIDLYWDHNVILRMDDPLLAALAKEAKPPVILRENPTAEVMSRIFFFDLAQKLTGLVRVRVWETPTSWAEYGERSCGCGDHFHSVTDDAAGDVYLSQNGLPDALEDRHA